MNDTGNGSKGQPGLAEAALFGLCPQCGAKTLFAGYAKFAPRCRACGLDNAQFNVGDGPAASWTGVWGAGVAARALWPDSGFPPPVWVHALLWIPMVFGSTLWGLRVTKAALLTAEFQRKAREATDKDVRGE